MYATIIPACFSSPTFDHDRVLEDLKIMKTDRLLLPGFNYIHTDPEVMEPYYKKAAEEVRWFHERGIWVGIWFWSFIIQGKNDFTKMVDVTGYSEGDKGVMNDSTISHICPLDEDYIRFMQAHVKRVASMHPDLILFDDDYSLGHHSGRPAQMCLCKHHLKRIGKILGEEPPKTEGLFETMFSGKPYRFRSAYMKGCGDCLVDFADRMREAV
ncbi:MAG: hypothetical protein IK088_04305, partial [Lachnospiraceae bacterium]|nr:hypothetical protein [Lachnospiraceae bacterium]